MRLKRGTSMLPEKSPPFTYGKKSVQRGSRAAVRSVIFVFMARNSSLITAWVLDESLALIRSMVVVKRPPVVKMSVSSAKKQKISRAMKWFMSWRRSEVPQSGLSFRSSR